MKKVLFLSIAICAISLVAQDDISLDKIKVTSAAGYEQDILNAPASISVINDKDIRKRENKDISQIVKDISGVYTSIGQDNNPKNKNMVSIRGMEAKYTKFLIDGKSISGEDAYSAYGSSGGTMAFLPPPFMIERVEIIRGPLSSLYGSDAMGGVINIITKKPTKDWEAYIGGSYTFSAKDYGSSYATDLGISGPIIKDILALTLYGRLLHKDEDKAYSGVPKDKNINFGVKLDYILGDSNLLNLNYAYAIEDFFRSSKYAQSTASIGLDRDKSDQISLTHIFKNENFSIENFIQDDITTTKTDKYHIDKSKLDNIIFKTKFSYEFSTNTLLAGLEYKNQKLEWKDTRYDLEKLSRWDGSIFAEDNYYATDDLTLTAGLRYNYDKDYGGHFSPRAYAVYSLNDNFSLKGGVSTGYTTPLIKDRNENFKTIIVGGTSIRPGRPSLKPESSINYEIGANYADDSLFGSFTVFHTEFRDKINSQASCKGSPRDYRNPAAWACDYKGEKWWGVYEFENIDRAEFSGIELAVKYNFDEFASINSNYTFNKSKLKNGIYKGLPVNNQPKHTLRVQGDIYPIKPLDIWAGINYDSKIKNIVDGRSKDRTDNTPSLSTFDIGINYFATDNLSFNIGIYNLLNKIYIKETFNRDVTVLDGRKFQVGFNARF